MKHSTLLLWHWYHLQSPLTLKYTVTKRLFFKNYFKDQSSDSAAQLPNLRAVNPPTLLSYVSQPRSPQKMLKNSSTSRLLFSKRRWFWESKPAGNRLTNVLVSHHGNSALTCLVLGLEKKPPEGWAIPCWMLAYLSQSASFLLTTLVCSVQGKWQGHC